MRLNVFSSPRSSKHPAGLKKATLPRVLYATAVFGGIVAIIAVLAVKVPTVGAGRLLLPDRTNKPHVVFVTGDCEYRSEISMPMMAKILEAKHGYRCTVLYARDEKTDELAPKFLKNIAGLEALKTADVAVFFLRFRQLPDEQLQQIRDYVNSGRPIVGLRTSTHAFRYPEDSTHAPWNDGFGREVFGQKWIRHHGHDSSTNVYVAVQDHPITRGLQPEFHCASWLYHVVPLNGDCTPLLFGAAVKGPVAQPEIFGNPNPVAWTKTYRGARVFFTTLGHPKDFENESVRRLLVNGIYWARGKEHEIPREGCAVEIQGEYVAPPTAAAVPDPTSPEGKKGHYASTDEGNPLGG